jgi:elongation factor Ts
VLIELNCETDFVARTDEFRTLAHDIAMHVAAMDPETVLAMEGSEPETSLMNQSYVKDPSKTIQDLVNDAIAKLGENVQVRRFTRFALSEE